MIQVVGVSNVVGGVERVAENLGPARMTETMHAVNRGLTAYHATVYGKGRKDLPQTLERHPDSDGRLTMTGKLRASLTSDDAEGAVRLAGPTGAAWGASVWYGAFAAYGTPTERRRPVVRLNKQTRQIVRDALERGVWRGAEGLLG